MPAVSPSLARLPQHAIFLSNPEEDEWELVDPPEAEAGPSSPHRASSTSSKPVARGVKPCKIAGRGNELLVVVENEIRMASMVRPWEVRKDCLGAFKTLRCPSISFRIISILPNRAGRLLAVVGETQIVVLRLPTSSQVGLTSGDLSCTGFLIDEVEYSVASRHAITKVTWHLFGEESNSLWILTSEGTLREYDVQQPYDPAQTFHFVTSAPTRFSAVDPLSRYATSFSFGMGPIGWGPLMVYVLMANGDIYTMGPILPLHTSLPLRYLQSLRACIDAAANARDSLEGRISLQRDWMDVVLRQIDSSTGEEVRVHPPHLTKSGGPAPGTHRPLLRQGPMVVSVAPPEDDDDAIASDVSILLAGQGDEDDIEAELGGGSAPVEPALVIAWSSGRTDLAYESETPEGRWISSKDPAERVSDMAVIESFTADGGGISGADVSFAAVIDASDGRILIHRGSGVDQISLGTDNATAMFLLQAPDSAPVEGCVIVHSISFGHAALMLVPEGRLATATLAHVESQPTRTINAPPPQDDAFESGLLIEAFDFDAFAKLRAYRSAALAKKPYQQISPSDIRDLAEAVSSVRTRCEAVRSASAKLEARVDLQILELSRQVRELRDIDRLIDAFRDTKTPVRAMRLQEHHTELVRRVERVSSKLANPLHVNLDAWTRQLSSTTNYIGKPGMQSRLKQMRDQVDGMAALLDSDEAPSPSDEPTHPDTAYIEPLREALTSRGEEIKRLTRKMDSLNVRISRAGIDLDEAEGE